MNKLPLRSAALVAMLLVIGTAHADPLHPIAANAYWHHESNFIFPATLGGLGRIGAPQEVDGSSTIGAYYGDGDTKRRLVVAIELFPARAGSEDLSGALAIDTLDLGRGRGSARRATFDKDIDEVRYSIEHGGWRMIVRARLLENTDAARIAAFVRALPVERLGGTDALCPNPGCGS